MLKGVLGVILLLNFFVSPVFAQDEATSSPTTIREVNRDSIDRFRKAREEAMKKREETLKNLRERKQAAIEDWEKRREEFKEKLSEIQDERKKKIVENIDGRILQVNAKWVEHWNNVLERLTAIIAKIDERSEGSVGTSAAKTAIANAQQAVNEQAEKTYEITIEDEETLGPNVRAVLKEFHEDLREVHALVKNAREEVATTLRNLKEGNEE